MRAPIAGLACLLFGAIASGCPANERPAGTVPGERAQGDMPEIDTRQTCELGCERIEACDSELADDGEDSATRPSAETCRAACPEFENRDTARALSQCLGLESCGAFAACTQVRPASFWLAATMPAAERSCESLCERSVACAEEQVGDAAGESRDQGPVPRADEGLSAELQETCLLQCSGVPEGSKSRTELVDCLDHTSCDGLLSCLDGWAETDYGPADGPAPGVDEACHAYCNRAIECGAEEEELSDAELAELKESMTGVYVECAMQCGKQRARQPSAGSSEGPFARCTARESCEEFSKCAEEL